MVVRFTCQGNGREAVIPSEALGRVACVRDRIAEGKRLDFPRGRQVFLQVMRDDGRPQRGFVIPGSPPGNLFVIGFVINGEILERGKPAAIDRIQQPYFIGDVVVAQGKDVATVHPLGGRT
jgi:hypothetical protein